MPRPGCWAVMQVELGFFDRSDISPINSLTIRDRGLPRWRFPVLIVHFPRGALLMFIVVHGEVALLSHSVAMAAATRLAFNTPNSSKITPFTKNYIDTERHQLKLLTRHSFFWPQVNWRLLGFLLGSRIPHFASSITALRIVCFIQPKVSCTISFL